MASSKVFVPRDSIIFCQIAGLQDRLGNYQDTSNTTAFVTVYDTTGAAMPTATNLALAYQVPGGSVSPGTWQVNIPASAFTATGSPWTFKLQIYDQNGMSGNLRREWDILGIDSEATY